MEAPPRADGRQAVERALITDTVGARKELYALDGELTIVADETILELEEQLEDDEGEPDGVRVEQRQCPVQAISFGGDLTMLSLTGEVVAEISNRIKDSLEGPVWTAAYANPAGYIVTDQILAVGRRPEVPARQGCATRAALQTE